MIIDTIRSAELPSIWANKKVSLSSMRYVDAAVLHLAAVALDAE
jgi:hypothetical protein